MLPALAGALVALDDSLDPMEFVRHWFATDFVIKRDVVQVVARWSRRQVPILLVTNQEPSRAAYLWRRLSPVVGASALVCSGGIGLTKEDPRFFLRAMDVLGIDGTSSVVFVDDALENVDAATAAGWTGVLFTDSGEWREVVSSLLFDARGEVTPWP